MRGWSLPCPYSPPPPRAPVWGVQGAEPPALLFPHFFGKKWGRRRRPKLRIVRFRAGPKAHSLRWASSPHRTRFAGLRRGPQLPQAPANGAGGNARLVFASQTQPTAAMSPRFGGSGGEAPDPSFPHFFGKKWGPRPGRPAPRGAPRRGNEGTPHPSGLRPSTFPPLGGRLRADDIRPCGPGNGFPHEILTDISKTGCRRRRASSVMSG